MSKLDKFLDGKGLPIPTMNYICNGCGRRITLDQKAIERSTNGYYRDPYCGHIQKVIDLAFEALRKEDGK